MAVVVLLAIGSCLPIPILLRTAREGELRQREQQPWSAKRYGWTLTGADGSLSPAAVIVCTLYSY